MYLDDIDNTIGVNTFQVLVDPELLAFQSMLDEILIESEKIIGNNMMQVSGLPTTRSLVGSWRDIFSARIKGDFRTFDEMVERHIKLCGEEFRSSTRKRVVRIVEGNDCYKMLKRLGG